MPIDPRSEEPEAAAIEKRRSYIPGNVPEMPSPLVEIEPQPADHIDPIDIP